jgi:hypothetical protein
MKVRVVFYCPRCGSLLFRPSTSRLFRDVFLRKVGVHPQRCYLCRVRFYLFKPLGLRPFVEALDRPLLGLPRPSASVQPAIGSESPAAVRHARDLLR